MKLGVRTLAPEHGKEIKKAAASPQASPTRSWRSTAATCAVQPAALRKIWTEPDWMNFKVRTKTYLADKVKQTTKEPLFELVWFDFFYGEHADLLHICQNPKSFVQKAIAKFGNEVPQLFVVTLLIPGTPIVACVQYFALKKDVLADRSEANELWKKFLEADDAFRRERFKLIPSIADGPWIVKKSVGNKPVILGHALQMNYYQTPHYLEACVDICSDRVAKHITSLCRSQSSNLRVDMGFVVEGQSEAELPERLLCCVEYDHIDLNLAVSIKDA